MAQAANDNKPNEIDEGIEIPVRWDTTVAPPTIYANQLIISHSGKEFYLIFGEVNTPLLMGVPGETVPDSLSIKPLVKIALTPEVMIEFTNAINKNVARYMNRQRAQESSEDEE